MNILLVIGTRPQIIKTAPIMHCAKQNGLEIDIIHTGQHYDYKLSNIFINEFSLPEPVANLNVGSGSHAYQTAEIIHRFDKYLDNREASLILIPGDTNSALAGALTSANHGIPIAHIEAGARCYDMTMAEERNRRLIDHCSDTLFAATRNCKRNLENESVLGTIHLSGDTMFDVFLRYYNKIESCEILDKLGLIEKEYSLLTLHRSENVDDPRKLTAIMRTIDSMKEKIIFPIHPRTRMRLDELNINMERKNIKIIDPVSYTDILKLLHHANIVLTDSGGLQKDAFWSKTPCITLREKTEWIETVEMGVNTITGANPKKIRDAVKDFFNNDEMKGRFNSNPFGDGEASKKIIKIIKEQY